MAQDYPGFLTEFQRAYVRGEKNLDDHSNPSVVKRRLRNRISGAEKDEALLEESDEEWVSDVLHRAPRNVHDPRGDDAPMTDEAVESYQGAAKAKAESVGVQSDSIELILETLEADIEEVQQKLEATEDGFRDEVVRELVQDTYTELFAKVFVMSCDGMVEGWADDVDTKEVVEVMIESIWPTKEQVLESAKEQL